MDNPSMHGFGQGGPRVRLAEAHAEFPNGVVSFRFSEPNGTLLRRYNFDSTVEGWTVDSGTLSNNAGKLRLVGPSSAFGTALEPAATPNVADGEFVFDITHVAYGVHYGGVVFRATDANNHYFIAIRPSTTTLGGGSGQFEVYKKVSGSLTSITTTPGSTFPIPFIAGAHHRVMVRFVGSDISLYLNDNLILNAVDATYTTGRCGIEAFNTTTTLDIDNARVYSLPSGWQPPA